ncbi:MAG: hypothetical protein FWF51_10225 [Chitinivibrionia bacterium]|nr:hypothetical protein [Chitinivibrionia bacterium]
MTKVLDLDEKLLSQATKITGIENPNVLIRIVLNEFVRTRSSVIPNSNPDKKINKKLIEKLSGCISKEKYEKMQKELSEMRNEWERNIY